MKAARCHEPYSAKPFPLSSALPPEQHDDDGDIYIMVKCLSVCHENSESPYSRDLVVSHVYRHFPYSRYLKVSRNSKTTKALEIMTFQRILFSPVSRHFPYSKSVWKQEPHPIKCFCASSHQILTKTASQST